MFVRTAREGALTLTICKHHRTTCGIPPALSIEGFDLFNCQRQSIALRKCSSRGEMYTASIAKAGTLRTRGEAGCAESG